MDGAASWDALEWTKIDPVSRGHGMEGFLLEAEEVIVQGHGVVLLNTKEAGTLSVTNFRLLFVNQLTQGIIELGTIPLATIEKFTDIQPRELLQVIGKDMRIILFDFRPRTMQKHAVVDALRKYTKPTQLWDLYTFSCGPSKFSNANPQLRLLKEYYRLLGKNFLHASSRRQAESLSVSNKCWRITTINSNYTLCPTYPSALLVPKSISDEEVQQASAFRAGRRLPAISWCNPGTGAVLARSSQPLVGLMMNLRNDADEKLVAALCTEMIDGSRRKLYIVDARPRANALANGAKGGGSESSSNYFQSEVVFLGIGNIHVMRESLSRLREYVDTNGTTSSDGMSSFLRNGGWTLGGGNLSSMSASVSTLGVSGWLIHVQSVLTGAAWIAARVALESASVLVHCSDGWDRTTQLVSLAGLMLDPYYRTFKGFQALVEKDWLAFGHPFSDRMGIPTVSEISSGPSELSRQSSLGSLSGSPMWNTSGSGSSSSTSGSMHGQMSNNYSPIFLQWVDCVAQLLRLYPCAFERFWLIFWIVYCLAASETSYATDVCGCLWMYLADLRASGGSSHVHFNIFYDPAKHDGPLKPPAATLAPTIWPQFHLRWSCPSESQGGELESQWRALSKNYSELAKAKEMAELRAQDLKIKMSSLNAELQKEKQAGYSALAIAKRACRESLAIRRALQSLGCKVHVSNNGENPIDQVNALLDKRENLSHSFRRDSIASHQQLDEKDDFSITISALEDSPISDDPKINRVCESLCPFRTREGCKWPDANCAQLGSQFVELKADFDAFDRLSIYECYFGTD
ncbi:Phosphatidylinositol-3-phosphatase myotubularin-1 [Ananas comosus]|uniref:Phosphatidylinositol-3-phosphatase myotubularin-1 n=1 Tax=Ananas comosus TaxID=4615 RepID=A0A199UHP1_ANACO|nr:Phosphatidylinositol-3-phosphatase myotubularin-1 [Ananas comosus]